MHIAKRIDGRMPQQLRPLQVSYNVFDYADGSVLFECGKTKVLCAVTLQQGVPPFLKGKKVGWLSAEYAMLPTSTVTRTPREIHSLKRTGRSVEISRLISRALRSIVDLSRIGEKTITIDCDVLQADGGTRAACITGAYMALKAAQGAWLAQGMLQHSILTDAVAAVSVGIEQERALLDINYQEDSAIDADFNFVLTKSGKIIEIQGSVEKNMISWDNFEQMKLYAIEGVNQIFAFVQAHEQKNNMSAVTVQKNSGSMFSLQSRLK